MDRRGFLKTLFASTVVLAFPFEGVLKAESQPVLYLPKLSKPQHICIVSDGCNHTIYVGGVKKAEVISSARYIGLTEEAKLLFTDEEPAYPLNMHTMTGGQRTLSFWRGGQPENEHLAAMRSFSRGISDQELDSLYKEFTS